MIFFFTLITCVLCIVRIWWGEILSWSFMGLKGLQSAKAYKYFWKKIDYVKVIKGKSRKMPSTTTLAQKRKSVEPGPNSKTTWHIHIFLSGMLYEKRHSKPKQYSCQLLSQNKGSDKSKLIINLTPHYWIEKWLFMELHCTRQKRSQLMNLADSTMFIFSSGKSGWNGQDISRHR